MSNKMIRPYKSFSLLAGICLLVGTLFAQVKSSTITGTITDPSGALVPRATVAVLDEDTNVSVETKTNESGDYAVPYLPVGRYTLLVKAGGFQAYRKTGIVVGGATTVRANAVLATGNVSTTVEVKADALAIQSESSTVQGSVGQQLIANLPNINNNPLYYATLEAGVLPTLAMQNSHLLGVGFNDRMSMSLLTINGGNAGTGDIQLDGVSVQGAAWHEIAVLPDRDSLQEVRVVTNNFSADTGSALGLISMTSKSGTNSYHGLLDYRLRNEGLNANGLYNNQYGIPRGKYRVNEYGGNVGGPVILPKLFNGKDKLFFFASYSRMTHDDTSNVQAKVPTAKERNGDFSSTMVGDNSGNPVPVNIFDPWSARPYQGSATVVQRTAYPNNVVTNPDPYGLKMLQAYPMPNHPPTDPWGDNNYFFSGIAPTIRDSLSTRLDYRLGDKNSIYFTFGESFGSVTQPNAWGPDNPFSLFANGGGDTNEANPYSAIGDTITLNSTTVVDVRYGVTRVHTASAFPAGTGFNYSDYGMPASVQSLVAMSGTAPSIGGFNEWTTLNHDGWRRKAENQLNHVVNGSVTKVLGKWTLKNGGEYRVYLGNWQDLEFATPSLCVWSCNQSTGQFADLYGNNSGLITNPANQGASGATAVTGAMGYFLDPGTTTKPALASKYAALFTQNDWRVNNKLTVNLGLRYEVQPGPTERYDRMSAYSLSGANPYATGLSGLPGASPLAGMGTVVFPGQNGVSRNLWTTTWNNISPRLGAAYRIGDSTVLRGGYGRTYAPSNTGFNANGSFYGTGPYSGGAKSIPFGLSPTNGIPVGRFEDPQNTQIIPATGNVPAPSNYCCNGGWVQQNNFQNAVMDQWNFFLERSFRRVWMLSAGYVGSHSSDLKWNGYPVTGAFDIPQSTLNSWRNTWVASNGLTDPAQAQVPNPLPGLIGYSGGATISALTAAQPYLPLNGATYAATVGSSSYNALQIRAQRSLADGLQLMLNYTWSKTTGIGDTSGGGNGVNTGGVDYRNLSNDHSLLYFDTPQRFVGVVSYLLPTGKGKALDPHNALLRAIIGDWQLASVITLQSGMPWGPNCGTMNGRCNQVAGEPVKVPKALQHWYDGKTAVTLPDGRSITPGANTYLMWNPDLFTQPTVQFSNGTYQVDQYQWGSTAPNEGWLRTPGLYTVNLTVNRSFQIREQVQLEFVAEATNLLNATNINPRAANNNWVGAALTADPSTDTKAGQNSNAGFGSLGMDFMEPRQVTLSMRLRF